MAVGSFERTLERFVRPRLPSIRQLWLRGEELPLVTMEPVHTAFALRSWTPKLEAEGPINQHFVQDLHTSGTHVLASVTFKKTKHSMPVYINSTKNALPVAKPGLAPMGSFA